MKGVLHVSYLHVARTLLDVGRCSDEHGSHIARVGLELDGASADQAVIVGISAEIEDPVWGALCLILPVQKVLPPGQGGAGQELQLISSL